MRVCACTCTETDTNTINKCHKKIHFNSSLIFYLELNLRPKQNLILYKKLLATTVEGLWCSPLLPDMGWKGCPGNGNTRHLCRVIANSPTHTKSKSRPVQGDWQGWGQGGGKSRLVQGDWWGWGQGGGSSQDVKSFPARHDKGKWSPYVTPTIPFAWNTSLCSLSFFSYFRGLCLFCLQTTYSTCLLETNIHGMYSLISGYRFRETR